MMHINKIIVSDAEKQVEEEIHSYKRKTLELMRSKRVKYCDAVKCFDLIKEHCASNPGPFTELNKFTFNSIDGEIQAIIQKSISY